MIKSYNLHQVGKSCKFTYIPHITNSSSAFFRFLLHLHVTYSFRFSRNCYLFPKNIVNLPSQI